MIPSADDLGRLIDSCLYMDVHTHCDHYKAESSLYRSLVDSKILSLSAGMDPASSEKTLFLGEQCQWIVPCFGIHPWKASLYGEEDVLTLRKRYKDCVMISEIGLDTVWAGNDTPLSSQIPLLKAQLKLAEEFNKPVTLHTKGAEKEILEILSEFTIPSVLIHWYDGTEEVLNGLLEYGSYFTIPPAIIAEPAYVKLLKKIPSDRLLPETDNPGTWPWYFQKEGRPEQIQEIYNVYARINSRDTTDIQRQFKENLRSFLRL